MNVIQCYATTNDSNENDKHHFCEAAVDRRGVLKKGPERPGRRPKRQDRNGQHLIALSNRFRVLQDLLKEEDTIIKNNWQAINEAPTPMCKEVLGHKRHHHKKWIPIDTLGNIQERKNKKIPINHS
ncbi:unnamed protein product [Schistosoma margrebowiei]|uniref:Uncharacterized protein n=1 Tax=Schistosoma margrebowiei TaxID=48269 RepID=A0A183MS81_9TREM|nr:unnamed protein product [Schistosoma margrebowiei]